MVLLDDQFDVGSRLLQALIERICSVSLRYFAKFCDVSVAFRAARCWMVS